MKNNLLYHYTSLEALKGILENGSLRATKAQHATNGANEIQYFYEDILTPAWECESNQVRKKALGELGKQIYDLFFGNDPITSAFITCFSSGRNPKLFDEYGRNVIIFDKEKLQQLLFREQKNYMCGSLGITKVLYEQNQHQEHLKELCALYIEKGIDQPLKGDGLKDIAVKILFACLFCKHKTDVHMHEQQEERLVIFSHYKESLKRIKSGKDNRKTRKPQNEFGIKPYIEILNDDKAAFIDCIKEVVLDRTNANDENIRELRSYFQHHDITTSTWSLQIQEAV